MGYVTWPCCGRIHTHTENPRRQMWHCECRQTGQLLLQQRTMIQLPQCYGPGCFFLSTPNCHGINKVVSSWEKGRKDKSLYFIHQGSSPVKLPSQTQPVLIWRLLPQYWATSSPADVQPCAPGLRSPGKSLLCQLCLCATEQSDYRIP